MTLGARLPRLGDGRLACLGQGLLCLAGPVLRFAAPIILLVTVLALVVSPWANQQIAELPAGFEQRDDVSKVAPGRFIESSNAQRVFFVESVDVEGAAVRNVFVSHRSQGKEGVIVAAEGVIESSPTATGSSCSNAAGATRASPAQRTTA